MGDGVSTHPHLDTMFDGLHGHVLIETQLSLELYKYFIYCIFLVRHVLGCKNLCKTIDERTNMMQLTVVNIFTTQGGCKNH